MWLLVCVLYCKGMMDDGGGVCALNPSPALPHCGTCRCRWTPLRNLCAHTPMPSIDRQLVHHHLLVDQARGRGDQVEKLRNVSCPVVQRLFSRAWPLEGDDAGRPVHASKNGPGYDKRADTLLQGVL